MGDFARLKQPALSTTAKTVERLQDTRETHWTYKERENRVRERERRRERGEEGDKTTSKPCAPVFRHSLIFTLLNFLHLRKNSK